MTDGYQEAGYGVGKIGFGQKAAVVVVDLQRVFTEERYPLGRSKLIHRATDNTAVLLKAARAAGLPVANVYTAYSSAADAPRWKVPYVTDEFRHGRELVEIAPRILDAGYDAVFCKAAPSAFFNTAVVPFLVRNEVDTVIITGCTTSGCVRATINDAFSYGFRVIVPEPCVGDVDQGPHDANLADVSRRYCDVLGQEEVIAAIERIAKSGKAT